MATQVTNYQCPACTGPLQFSAASGKLECEYCESQFTVEEVEAFHASKDQQAAEAFSEEEEALTEFREEETSWDTSGLSDDWGEEGSQMRSYTCPSCGAQLICDATTAATACPYCGNNTIVPGQFAGALKPDLVLPFQLDKAAALAALKQHYKGKWLLPRAFTEHNHLEKIQGVYVPFWLYDAQVEVDARFQGIHTTVSRSHDYEITERSYFNVRRRGTVAFTGVPVDGSSKMDDAYMDSLEPFDYDRMKPFSTAYLPGYLADRFDRDADACAQRADERCEKTAVDTVRSTVLGYQEVRSTGHSSFIRRGKVRYALLPVWVLHTKWENTDYLFMMNGQTGKFVGDLPVDRKKSLIATAALTCVLTLLFQLTGIGPFVALVLSDLFG